MSTTFREQGIFLTAVLLLIASIITVASPSSGDLLGAPVIDDPTEADPTDPASGPGTPTLGPSPTVAPSPTGGASPSRGDGDPDDPTSGDSPTTDPSTPSLYEADLFSGAENTRGITDDRIRFCGHAALTLAAAFDTSPEDLSVYWEEVSDQGGIYGRDVEISWENDNYSSDGAISAMTACADKDPFMILGGVGFDQIPGARNFAEANKELYLHHIAVRPDNPVYSFTLQPTVEQTGAAFGEYLVSRYRNQSIAIIYRQSPNWDPGRHAGAEILRANGIQPTEVPVQNNQGSYGAAINQVRNHDVVWVWENALNAANIIIQANLQGVRPKWVLFPFQTTLDLLGDRQALEPPIDGIATWPSYVPGGYGSAWDEFDLGDEIHAFETAYARRRPRTQTNDILFQVWVGNKILHRLLLECGRDCTRNRFAGMLEEGLKLRVNPACTIDTTGRASMDGRLGGHEFVVQEAYGTSNGPAWRTTQWCTRRPR